MIKGRINSFQSLGALDGPGIRFVAFMQGCNLRCGCCHNPETWNLEDGTEYTPFEVFEKVKRFKSYYGKNGGITVSGGEPLLQPEFVYELFDLCRKEGIDTCIDTSGSIFNDKVLDVLSVTDRVLLDVKYFNSSDYKKYVGCDLEQPLNFLKILDDLHIPTTIRTVIIPTLNDNDENIKFLNALASTHSCIDKIELLPFKKLCKVKYDDLKLRFRFNNFEEPGNAQMDHLNSLICKERK